MAERADVGQGRVGAAWECRRLSGRDGNGYNWTNVVWAVCSGGEVLFSLADESLAREIVADHNARAALEPAPAVGEKEEG